jgi:hypothetical protein
LHDFEIYEAFLKIVGLVNCEPNGDRAFVVPVNFMFFYGGAIGSSTVFGRDRGREVPLYVAGTADERYIVQIDNLGMLDSADGGTIEGAHPNNELEFWLQIISVFDCCDMRRKKQKRYVPVEPSILECWKAWLVECADGMREWQIAYLKGSYSTVQE